MKPKRTQWFFGFLDYQHVLPHFVNVFSTNTVERFFLFKNEWVAFSAIQTKMLATQNWQWVFTLDKIFTFEQNFHVLDDCNQMLFSKQHLNFNFHILLVSLLWFMQAQSAIVELCLPLVGIFSIQQLFFLRQLPVLLIPFDSLLVFMETAATQQIKFLGHFPPVSFQGPMFYHKMIHACSTRVLFYQKDSWWSLTYRWLLDKQFLSYLRLNWFQCLIHKILSWCSIGISKLDI